MHPNPILRNALMIRLSGSMDSRLLFVFVIRAKLITFGAFPRLFSKSSSFCRLGFVRSKISELFFKNHLVLWFGARLLIHFRVVFQKSSRFVVWGTSAHNDMVDVYLYIYMLYVCSTIIPLLQYVLCHD